MLTHVYSYIHTYMYVHIQYTKIHAIDAYMTYFDAYMTYVNKYTLINMRVCPYEHVYN